MAEGAPQDMALMVVGASAGSMEASAELVRRLPADIPAAVCNVVYFLVTAPATSRLPHILNQAGTLEAQHATHGQRIEREFIYSEL